jgi:NifB/MoaA-like Fe-S oxidoreductase
MPGATVTAATMEGTANISVRNMENMSNVFFISINRLFGAKIEKNSVDSKFLGKKITVRRQKHPFR